MLKKEKDLFEKHKMSAERRQKQKEEQNEKKANELESSRSE